MRTFCIRVIRQIIFLAVLILVIQSCTNNYNNNPLTPGNHERGEIVQSANLGFMTIADIQQIISDMNMSVPFTLNYPVATISLSYYSADATGTEIIVSGALIIPQGASNLPLVSIQHGTQTKDDLVASVSPLNSTEGIVGLIMASMGYVVVVPDYPGFGVSDIMHPYIHAASLIPCVIDLLRAGNSYSSANEISLDGRIFLTGYSEGGYVTLVTQKEIEENYSAEFNLTAVAPLAGPYDLQGMMQAIFQSGTYSDLAYIAFFLTAYNNIYEWNRLNDFFNASYVSIIPGLFDGSNTWGEITSQLPSTFTQLMNPDFIESYNNSTEPDFVAAVNENTLLDWRPLTPVHFFHGDADEVVPIENALTALNSFNANGATDVQLTTISGGTHTSAGPQAIIGAIQWFEDF